MIDKFNFYDIYGYFVPGLALLAVLWLPFGLLKDQWPSADWGSAIVGVVAAYLLGHLLQAVAGKVVPSRTHAGRFPSAALLDKDSTIAAPLQDMLANSIEGKFGLELKPGQPQSDSTDAVRDEASNIVRLLLVRDKGTSYSEQFEGMYSLSRGLFAALCVAVAYWFGWGSGVCQRRWTEMIASFVIVLALVVSSIIGYEVTVRSNRLKADVQQKLWYWYALSLLVTLFCVGYVLGGRHAVTRLVAGDLALAALAAVPLAIRTYGQYKSFTESYAKAIWHDYLAYLSKASLGSTDSDE